MPPKGFYFNEKKCTFCLDRPEGMPRACEEICLTNAIIAGTMDELDELAASRLPHD